MAFSRGSETADLAELLSQTNEILLQIMANSTIGGGFLVSPASTFETKNLFIANANAPSLPIGTEVVRKTEITPSGAPVYTYFNATTGLQLFGLTSEDLTDSISSIPLRIIGEQTINFGATPTSVSLSVPTLAAGTLVGANIEVTAGQSIRHRKTGTAATLADGAISYNGFPFQITAPDCANFRMIGAAGTSVYVEFLGY